MIVRRNATWFCRTQPVARAGGRLRAERKAVFIQTPFSSVFNFTVTIPLHDRFFCREVLVPENRGITEGRLCRLPGL